MTQNNSQFRRRMVRRPVTNRLLSGALSLSGLQGSGRGTYRAFPVKKVTLRMSSISPFKILLIDDSEVVGPRVLALLSGIPGVEVIGQAKTVQDGMTLLEDTNPGIIFLDINLPDGSGIDLLRGLRTRLPYIYVIMLTNSSDTLYEIKCAQLGADYFLDKTRDFDKIVGLIEELIS